MNKLPALIFVVVGMILGTSSGSAEENGDLAFHPADTTSPRATLQTFIKSANELYDGLVKERYFDGGNSRYRQTFNRVYDCLDVSQLPSFARRNRAAEVSICLKELLDRVEIPDWSKIPGESDDVDGNDEKEVARYRIPGTRITIVRIEEGPRKHEYLFSAGTVERAVEYYQDMRAVPYRENGPKTTPNFYRWFTSLPGSPTVGALTTRLPTWCHDRWGSMSMWKWPAVILGVVVWMTLVVYCYKIHRAINRRWRKTHLLIYWLSLTFPVLAVLASVVFQDFIGSTLMIRGKPLYFLDFVAEVIVILTSIPVVFGINNRIADSIIATPRIKPEGLDAQLIRIVSRLASIAIGTIIFLYGGQYLGIPLPTLLASAGVGGLAVALAAQDTLKNLFGTLMLMSDKPFRVGDRIVFGRYDGIVEDVGLRSTRIRLLTGHLTTIPNDELARSDIENVGRRPHIRRVCDLALSYETTPSQLERALEIVRNQLDNHEGMNPDFPPRVHFMDFGERGFQLRMMYWYSPPNYWDFVAFNEKLNINILQEFEAAGISLEVPTNIKIEPTPDAMDAGDQ